MEFGAVDFVSNVLTPDHQSNRDLRAQKCKQHSQSKIQSSKTKMPTIVGKRELSLNGIWAESVLHILLDALCAQHQALENAYSELEVERSASAESMDDALLMISRLQKEKFKVEMQHTQYRREAEVKLACVHETYNCYEDLLSRKNKEIQGLQWQLEDYKRRFLTFGIYDSEINDIGLPATRSADVDARTGVDSCAVGCIENSAVSLDVERIGSHDSAGFTAQNRDKYEKICSKCNSSIGSCHGEVSATAGFSNYVETNLVVNGGDGHAKSEFSTGKARERPAISSEDYSYSGWSQLSEAIEALQKRLNLLSEKENNSDSENESRFCCEKLQSALTVYINSLRQGSNVRQRMPAFFEPMEADEEDESDGFLEVHVDTEQIRDLPQKIDPLSKRCEENEFSSVSIGKIGSLEPYMIRGEENEFSSVSIGKNGSLEPYMIRVRPVESMIMKIYTDPFPKRYEEDRFSSLCIGENGRLETYKVWPRLVKSVIMTKNASEDNSDSIKLAIDSFNVKSFKQYAQTFHNSEEVAKGQKIVRMPSLLGRGLTVASHTKGLLSGLFVGVQTMLFFRDGLHRRNYHSTRCKNAGLSNLLEDEDRSENL